MTPLSPFDREEWNRATPANPSAYERQSYAREPEGHHREIALRIAIALVGLAGCVVVFACGGGAS